MPAELPASGQYVHLRDHDYQYGEGALTFHVSEVGATFRDGDDSRWVALTGSLVLSNGTTSPLSHTLSARVSGIMVVSAPDGIS